MFALLEGTGFTRVRSAVVVAIPIPEGVHAELAEAYRVRAVMMTAVKPMAG